MSDQLEAFAVQMRHGLLAASVAIGVDVMGELVDAEVTESRDRRAVTTRSVRRTGTTHRGLQRRQQPIKVDCRQPVVARSRDRFEITPRARKTREKMFISFLLS